MKIERIGLNRRALSLVEVGLASFIMALAILPMMTGVTQVGRGLGMTSEYSQALFLSQMVIEDEQARFEVNPLALMVDESSLGVPVTSVVDGQSPYFQAIEDDEAPHGRIQPGRDRAIDQTKDQVLYNHLSRFRLGVNVAFTAHKDIPSQPEALAEFVVNTSWIGRDGKSRTFDVPALVSRPVIEGRSAELTHEDAVVYHDMIRMHFYPDEPDGTTLAQVVAARGGDLDTVVSVGLLALMEMSMESEFTDRDDEIEEIETIRKGFGANDWELKAEADIWEGQVQEHKASMAVHIPMSVAKHIEFLAQGDFMTRMGSPRPEPERFIPHIWRFGFLPRSSLEDGLKALETLAKAAQGEEGAALKPRRRLSLQYRVVELGTFLFLAGLQARPFLNALLDEMILEQQGKNPYVVVYAQQQKELLGNQAKTNQIFSSWVTNLNGYNQLPVQVDELIRTALVHEPNVGEMVVTDVGAIPTDAAGAVAARQAANAANRAARQAASDPNALPADTAATFSAPATPATT